MLPARWAGQAHRVVARLAMRELLAQPLAAILELVPEARPGPLAQARVAPLALRELRVAVAEAAADRAPIPKT